jgi:hypothetical protein
MVFADMQVGVSSGPPIRSDRASAAVLLSDGIHESFESAFDRLYRIPIPQGCIDVPAEVGWHLAAGFPDDQHIVLPFQPDEVSRLEDHVYREARPVPPSRGLQDRHPW